MIEPTVRRLLAWSIAIVLALAGVVTADVPARAATFQRLAGPDRYATAVEVSRAFHDPGLPIAYVARGDLFPDALSAGSPAALADGPVLLVQPGAIPAVVADELDRLRPDRIVVIGAEGSVSAAVFDQLAAYHTGGGITRLAGADRYATSVAVSRAHFDPGGVVYVATGELFPDALAAGPAAARDRGPVLLVRQNQIPGVVAEELERLSPSRIVIVGGPGAVSSAVESALGTYTSGGAQRIAGADRYETAIRIAETFGDPATAFLATGRDFPDALAAGAAGGRIGAPVLTAPGNRVPMLGSVEDALGRIGPATVHPVGGASVVLNSTVLEVQAALEGVPPLPACTYEDILTPLTGTRDWRANLVDTRLMVPADYVPPNLVSTANAGLSGGYLIRSLVIPDLSALVSAAAANGTPIDIVSAYRSYEQQEQTFNYWVSQVGYEEALLVSARPGHSEHQLGTTLDFTSLGGAAPWEYSDWAQTPAGAWMAANAWQYGFVMSYPRDSFDVACYSYEPWHYRYVGRTVAAGIRASGLTSREWLWRQGYGVN